jgi:hypothetical protein
VGGFTFYYPSLSKTQNSLKKYLSTFPASTSKVLNMCHSGMVKAIGFKNTKPR